MLTFFKILDAFWKKEILPSKGIIKNAVSDVKLNKEALFILANTKDNAAVKVTCLFKVIKGLLFPDHISNIVMVKKF